MELYLTVQEKIEMVLIYGESGRNLADAVNIYNQRFPDRVRSRTSFFRTIKQFTAEGSVKPKKKPVEQQSLKEIMKLMY